MEKAIEIKELYSDQTNIQFSLSSDKSIYSYNENKGYSYIDDFSDYRRMIISQNRLNDIEIAKNILNKYDRDIILTKKTDIHSNTVEQHLEKMLSDKFYKFLKYYNKIDFLYNRTKNFILKENQFLNCNNNEYIFVSFNKHYSNGINKKRFYFFKSLDELFKSKIDVEDEFLKSTIKDDKVEKNYDLIFLNTASPIIFHEIIGHQLEKDVRTCYHINDYITKFPITAYSNDFFLVDKQKFDDEGIQIKSHKIVKDGQIISLMSDTHSTKNKNNFFKIGNCRRENYKFYPEPRMYRLSIDTGKKTISQIIHSTYEGIIINEIYDAYIENGEVLLKALSEFEIINGLLIRKPRILFIKDKIKSFQLNIKEISDTSNLMSMLCNKQSGKIYTEAEAPDVKISNINIVKGWLL